jgi:GAF domain-containing protein
MRKLRRLLSFDAPAAHAVFPSVIFATLFGVAAWLSWSQATDERRDLITDTQLVADGFADRCQILMSDEIRPLRRLEREISSGIIRTERDFESAAQSIQRGVQSFECIIWLGSDGAAKAVATKNSAKPDVSAMRDWGEILSRTRQAKRQPLFVRGDAQASQWLIVSLWGPDTEPGATGFRGAVVGRGNFLQRLDDEKVAGLFAVEIRDENHRVIYNSGSAAFHEYAPPPSTMYVGDQKWEVRLWPTQAFVNSRRRPAPKLLLWGGLAIAALASAAVLQALRHRRRDLLRSREYVDALQAVNQVSAAITGKPGASEEILQHLAAAAARVMGMSMMVVWLYDASKRTLSLAYSRNLSPLPPKSVYSIEETQVSKYCMERGEVVTVSDTKRGGPFPPEDMRRHGIRSLVHLPLVIRGEPMGVIMLADARPKRFNDADVRMARLLATQAAVALLNHRLHEEMNAALRSLQNVLQQRETLYAVNTAIQNAGSAKEALDRIAELAPRALDVDVCAVILRNDDSEVATIVAVTPVEPPFPLPVNTVGRCAIAAEVFRARKPVVVEDAANDPEFKRFGVTGIGSALYVPLAGEGRQVMGVLSLMRRTAGSFDQEQVKLAEVFAARAGGAIHAARLLEQTRRQAQTNATLLRELNHRVKNNLAGIVGLFSLGAPPMAPAARQWLDRAIDRINTMARAHSLFSGGLARVTLGELIDTTLATVLPARGQRVEVRTDVTGADVTLSTDQAVTLAMVLHELAYNALAHATGCLIIQARSVGDGNRIAIDVIDEPAAELAVVPAPASGEEVSPATNTHWLASAVEPRGVNGGGSGLDLVRGLVARELHGQFSLAASSSGRGTLARVEFDVASNLSWTRGGIDDAIHEGTNGGPNGQGG